jgi:sporulation protein YunB
VKNQVRRNRNRLLRNFCFLLFVVFGLLIFLEINLAPAIQSIAEAKTKLAATKIINEAVSRNTINNKYGDIMDIHKDSQDRVVLMMPNTRVINQLATQTTLEIERDLNDLKSQGISIPLGLITGSALLSNTGPPLKVEVVPVGTVDVDVMDEFVEAGINQTKHRIFFNIKTDLKVVVPMMGSTINISMQVPVTESIIIGPVPEWYMKFTS